MPRVVNLNKRVKKEETAAKSPYVLDLKRELEKRAAQKRLDRQSDLRKILLLAISRLHLLKTKSRAGFNRRKRKFNDIKNRIKDFKLKPRFLKSKFEPAVENTKNLSPSAARKQKNKKIKNILVWRGLNRKIKRLKNKETEKLEIGCDRVKDDLKGRLVTPFYIFRLKNSAINVSLFLLFIAVLVLPIKGFSYVQGLTAQREMIFDHATVAAGYLREVKDAGLTTDLEAVERNFSEAETEFILARQEVEEINKFTQTLIGIIPRLGDSFKAGEKVLVLGEYLAKAGRYLTEIVGILQNDFADNQLPTVKLEIIRDNLSLTLWQIRRASDVSGEIKIFDVPPEYQSEMAIVQKYLPQIIQKTERLLRYVEIVQKILGHKELKRYLFVFQNNNELRATGGFVGSYALIDFNQGKIENMEIPTGGSYDLEGGELEKIIAPAALRLINSNWHFWDANWFFDFPTSAEKLIEFYNISGGPTVDGVIAINANLMQELVGAVGPIKIGNYGCESSTSFQKKLQSSSSNPLKREELSGANRFGDAAEFAECVEFTLTGENFVKILQKEGQKHKFEKEPKKLLSLAGREIVKRLADHPESWLKILPILNRGLKQKDLQFYFVSYDLEREMMDLGWSGRVLKTAKDYLAVVHTNLGGGKTDGVIKNEIWHNVEILKNGEIMDTLIITRQHQGQKGDLLTGVANNDYLRVYVPLGSRLISAYGFSKMPADAFEVPEEGYRKDKLIAEMENRARVDRMSGTQIFIESNKTVFANWLHIESGETKSVYLKYRLPFIIAKNQTSKKNYTLWEQISLTVNPKLQSKILPVGGDLDYYSLLIQKQSGAGKTNFISRIKLPTDYKAIWSHPDDLQARGDSYQLTTVLKQDMIEAIVIK